MRVTSKGQVTIPIDLREKFGIFADSEVEFGTQGNLITIRKAKPKKGKKSRGEQIVDRLRGSGHGRLTTDQILKLMRGND